MTKFSLLIIVSFLLSSCLTKILLKSMGVFDERAVEQKITNGQKN
jgi:hypothetical protein